MVDYPSNMNHHGEINTMKPILADYLDICLKFRKEYLSKPERKQRHTLLTEWAKAEYEEGKLTIPELYEFWDSHKEVSYHKIFIEKVILPTVNEDFQNGEIDGLKFLFYCLRGQDRIEYIATSSPVAIFSDAHNHRYSALQLAEIVLKKEPDNEDALKTKYFLEKERLWYSIHEIPLGVLNEGSEANLSDIPNMLRAVDTFEAVSKKLTMDDDTTLIEDCRKFYVAYQEYLKHRKQNLTFEDYLKRNHIPYERYCSTFYFR